MRCTSFGWTSITIMNASCGDYKSLIFKYLKNFMLHSFKLLYTLRRTFHLRYCKLKRKTFYRQLFKEFVLRNAWKKASLRTLHIPRDINTYLRKNTSGYSLLASKAGKVFRRKIDYNTFLALSPGRPAFSTRCWIEFLAGKLLQLSPAWCQGTVRQFST